MPRKNRYFTQGRLWHLTHRCHNGDFLLKFGKDRDAYRDLLRARLQGAGVDLYNYCLTANHVHLLVQSDSGMDIPALMKSVAGEFAQAYNRRKRRTGAFWGDRYHATLVDSGKYLWRCLQYIDLNMVRAGRVMHPADWPWCGYHELVGDRKRYCLINRDGLRLALNFTSIESFNAEYRNGIVARLANQDLIREPYWTEVLAVGREEFVNEMAKTILNRRELEIAQEPSSGKAYILRERTICYGNS
ncbi:MAG: transposase [Lentisphaerae bacterium]|nr:transposase [Lentisphaerota bacterium]